MEKIKNFRSTLTPYGGREISFEWVGVGFSTSNATMDEFTKKLIQKAGDSTYRWHPAFQADDVYGDSGHIPELDEEETLGLISRVNPNFWNITSVPGDTGQKYFYMGRLVRPDKTAKKIAEVADRFLKRKASISELREAVKTAKGE